MNSNNTFDLAVQGLEVKWPACSAPEKLLSGTIGVAKLLTTRVAVSIFVIMPPLKYHLIIKNRFLYFKAKYYYFKINEKSYLLPFHRNNAGDVRPGNNLNLNL